MAAQSPDDMDLVRRASSDAEAFGLLYERHVRRIYNYIYYRTGDHHDAEDLTARVFQRALRHVESFVDKGVPVSAWLYRIAHNLVANWHRDRSRRPVVPLEDQQAATSLADHPEAEALTAEEHQVLLDVVRRLAPERQQLLILKFVERLSNAEIAEITGRTEGAVKSLYHRTLKSLREDLVPGSSGRASEPKSRRGEARRGGRQPGRDSSSVREPGSMAPGEEDEA